MSTATLTNAVGQATGNPSGHHQRPDVCDAYRALWAMTRDERIAAMWRENSPRGSSASGPRAHSTRCHC
jgi:hypothetical protein